VEETEIADQARRLHETYGDKAGPQAAYRELEAEENGDDNAAQDWHRVRVVLQDMMG